MRLRVQRLDDAATLPTVAHEGDAGYDLYAIEPVELAPGERAMVRTGIAIEVSNGHAALVVPRSGTAARHGISVVNAPGLIDSGYRGEIRVVLLNTDRREPFTVEPGMRIAQLVLAPVASVRLVEARELAASERGARGFGSSA